MKRVAVSLLFGSLWTVSAIAQTPLCVWNGTSLSCPDTPAPGAPPAQQIQPGGLPTPQRRLAEIQAQADFDRALIAARAAEDTRRVQVLERADALVTAGRCTDAETLVREKAPAAVSAIASRCAATRK
jgi:hypothetical protein